MNATLTLSVNFVVLSTNSFALKITLKTSRQAPNTAYGSQYVLPCIKL